jgi:hypothetical protein
VFVVIGSTTGAASLFNFVVTGDIIGSTGKVGDWTWGNTGTGTGTGTGGITEGMKPLLPYAKDNAELIVLPKRLKEFVAERLPVAAVFARKLLHKNNFCICLAPNLNKNLPSLEEVDKSLEFLLILLLLYTGILSLGDSWCEMGNFCTNKITGLVETGSSNTSNISDDPKRTQNAAVIILLLLLFLWRETRGVLQGTRRVSGEPLVCFRQLSELFVIGRENIE